ncbi:MAG: MarR family transcriptional regulator, partial [Myxococcales bacterium]|nr:MarR family transcriptional regulator [Myxococcales bacterium]
MGSHALSHTNPETARILASLRRLVRFLRLENGSRNAKLSTAQLFVLVQLSQGVSASIRELAERTMT